MPIHRKLAELSFFIVFFFSGASSAQSIGGCDNYAPTEGQTVTCSPTITPAAATGVQSTTSASNNNITVNVLSGTTLSISGAPIGIGSGSTVNNDGTLNSRLFSNGYGMSSGTNGRSQAGGSTLNNFSTGQIITGGGGSDGIYILAGNATSRSNTILNAGRVQTTGADAIGVHISSGATSTAIQNAITNSGTITTSGGSSFGIRLQSAQASGSIINSGNITTSGLGADGISVRNTGNIISIDNSGTLTVNGAARGISITGAASIVNSGTISAKSEAIYFDNPTTNTAANSVTLLAGSVIQGSIRFNSNKTQEKLIFDGYTNSNFNNLITGVNIIEATGNSHVVLNNASALTLGNGAINVENGSQLEIVSSLADITPPFTPGQTRLNKIGNGVLVLSGTNTFSGNTTVSSGALILNGSIASNTTVMTGARLQGGGSINGNVTNFGVIQPSFNGAPTNLTIKGNYTSNGGVFATALYAQSTQLIADTLSIQGAGNSASGSTQIGLINTQLLGNPTTGDGILLIQATSGVTTGNNAFYYPNRIAVGAYEYQIVKGGTNSPENWYLRSDNSASLEVAAAYGSQPVVDYVPPAQPAQQTEQAVPPVVVPNIAPVPTTVTPEPSQRIEVANYPSIASLARLYMLSTVDSFDQRRSDLAQTNGALGINNSKTSWGRVLGKSGDLRSDDRNQGPALNARTYAIQLGTDLYRHQAADGSQTWIGPYLTLGQASGNTYSSNGSFKTGNVLLQGYSLGLNATHLTAQGLYVDALLQATRFSGVRANSILGSSINTTGWGLTASLETGWRINMTGRVKVTPQAQLIYNNTQMNDTADWYANIGIPNDASLLGRLGVKVSYDNTTSSGPATQAWLRLSGLSMLSGRNSQIVFQSPSGNSNVAFNAQTPANWMSVDAGLNVALSKSSQLSFTLGYDTSVTNAYRGGYGQIGLQVAF